MYKHYLKSNHWLKVKADMYVKNRYCCYFCSKRRKLEIHHITYENIGKEMIEDLVYLCHSCHTKATFSSEKDVIQKWLERKRFRNLKARTYPKPKKSLTRHLENVKRKNKNKYKNRYKKVKRTPMKNFAGLFTWKAKTL